jgi:hypothetical protein
MVAIKYQKRQEAAINQGNISFKKTTAVLFYRCDPTH